jgi:hypothetical protein
VAGNYWWYASYSGDANNNASASTCGAAMAKTVVYNVTSAASVSDSTFFSNSSTTSQFTVSPNTTYVLLVSRHSTGSDAITSISSSGLSPALSTSSFTSISSQSYNTSDYQWAYYMTTGSASGTGSLTVNFAQRLFIGNQVTIINLIRLQGNSTTTPILTANVGKATGTATSATANLPNAPSGADAGLVFLSAQQGLGLPAPTASPAMSNVFYSQQTAGTMGIYSKVPASQSESFGVGSNRIWGTIALEINHG